MPYQVGFYGFNKSSDIVLEQMGERFRARAYIYSGDHKYGLSISKTFRGDSLDEVADKALEWFAEEMFDKPLLMHTGKYSEKFPTSVWDVDKQAKMMAFNLREELGN